MDLHVHPRSDGYWAVTPGGAGRAASLHDCRDAATSWALRRAAELGGAEVVVHDPLRGRQRLHAPPAQQRVPAHH